MIIYDSPLGKIEFITIKNTIIKKETNFIMFKVKKLYHDNLQENYINQLYSELLKFYKKLLKEKTHFAQIYDLTALQTSSIFRDVKFGKEYGNFLQENVEKILEKCCSGTAIIVNSEIIKGIVNTVLLFYRNIKPTQVHNSYDESFEWLWPLIKEDKHKQTLTNA